MVVNSQPAPPIGRFEEVPELLMRLRSILFRPQLLDEVEPQVKADVIKAAIEAVDSHVRTFPLAWPALRERILLLHAGSIPEVDEMLASEEDSE